MLICPIMGQIRGKKFQSLFVISEPDYPAVQGRKMLQSKSSVIMNVQVTNEDKWELLIRNNQFKELDLPSDAIIKDVKSDVSFIHIVFDEISSGMLKYLETNIRYCIDNYSSSSSFGCCSKYEKCLFLAFYKIMLDTNLQKVQICCNINFNNHKSCF